MISCILPVSYTHLIFQIRRVAPGFSVEIGSSGSQSTVPDDLYHCLNQFEVIDRELIGIPAVLIITPIGVDGAQHAGMLGSIDANRGDYQNGWDTDQFPIDNFELVQAMIQIIRNGGLGTGGTNFDAKTRRNSTDLEDKMCIRDR